MAGEAAAWLQIQIAGDDIDGTHGSGIEVCGNEQFYLGRDTELCRYSWYDDLTISRLHLRIHCILYELDPVAAIAPFVYATDLSANGTYLKKSNTECTASQGPGILMGHNNTFLLDNGDELRISDTVSLIYWSIRPVELVELTPVQEREKSTFASRYLVTGRLLGEGGYGKVLVGVHQDTQRQLACKIIRLDKMYTKLAVPNLRLPTDGRVERVPKTRKRWPTKVANCFREFEILKDLSHPNIVALEKVFWSHNTIYIFQELVTGGDLFSFLEFKNGRLDSMQGAAVMRQILKGIEYIHDQDIVHRDLKPDNILMTSLEDGARVVITDFGNARFLPGKNSPSAVKTDKYQRMFSYVGTLEFAAPEIHRANRAIPVDDGYSKSVDMWSIGSITATVLTGDVIFTDRTHPDYYKDPRSVIMGLAAVCDLSVLDDEYHPSWNVIGGRPKDFIKRLLVLEEDDRMTASEALVHPWFSSYAEDFEDLYARSIADWVPRRKNLQLVERISKLMPDLAAAGLPGNILSQKIISRHFSPSQPGPTYSNLLKTSASQRWRADISLPSIPGDYEAAQFATQVQPPLYDTKEAEHKRQQVSESNNPIQSGQQSYGADLPDNTEFQLYDTHASRNTKISLERETSIDSSLSQPSLTNAAATGRHDNNAEDDEDEDSYGSTESLNRVMNDYSQQGYCIRVRQSPVFQEAQELVQVGETPFAEQIGHEGYGENEDDDQQAEESYYQTQFPEEYQQQQGEEDEDSILVRETPPEILRKHPRSSDETLPTYDLWFGDKGADAETDADEYGKRRKLSRYPR
ncbi:Pkinase-domain-containing protein [Clathrospora elynae]|uniref:Pkinase-domain-containing protein n=1 Tax=Clathrospora elynae TaxID=706981 RepID=A0A6A5T2D3_9PLEO|nr:Pkinase-domain-containing protein [Clathrospora elynae]